MSIYAIGDVQGCFQELQDLLDLINFDESNDQLWFAGDIVNKGPDSLAALRFVKRLNAVTVLGNHDLHLLAIDAGIAAVTKKDTLDAILSAGDRKELMSWLRSRPLIHHDPDMDVLLMHAGLPPQWDTGLAMACAREAEAEIRSGDGSEFFSNIYGDRPHTWKGNLQGWDRLRFVVNALTRIRYCDAGGRMDFTQKGPPGTQPPPWLPWFCVETRKSRKTAVLFGHWASIYYGNAGVDFAQYNVYPLDMGCVWGRKLAAVRLEDRKFFEVPSRQKDD